jgi:putative heme iron utilization protein
MARGWESKSAESQIETSQSERKETARNRLTPEGAAALRKKETLLLARAHLQQQMQASQHPLHRVMLQNALTDLEKQLADLGALDRAAGSH